MTEHERKLEIVLAAFHAIDKTPEGAKDRYREIAEDLLSRLIPVDDTPIHNHFSDD
jgi:hypothetical protein